MDFTAAIGKHAAPDPRLESHMFEDENHLSVVEATQSRGLEFLYARPQPK
jgi:hypothetical protein